MPFHAAPISLLRIDTAHEIASWFRGAYTDYLHDLSQFDPAAYSLDEAGVWQPDHVPFWLSDPHVQTLVALTADRPFGFACVGTSAFPYKAQTSDHCLAELYVQASSSRRLGRAPTALAFSESSRCLPTSLTSRGEHAGFGRGMPLELSEAGTPIAE